MNLRHPPSTHLPSVFLPHVHGLPGQGAALAGSLSLKARRANIKKTGHRKRRLLVVISGAHQSRMGDFCQTNPFSTKYPVLSVKLILPRRQGRARRMMNGSPSRLLDARCKSDGRFLRGFLSLALLQPLEIKPNQGKSNQKISTPCEVSRVASPGFSHRPNSKCPQDF